MNVLLKNKQLIGVSLGFILIVLLGSFFVLTSKKEDLSSVSFSLASKENPVWRFEGVYESSNELKRKAKNTIKDLEQQRKDGTYSEYSLNIGIAQQYELLGQGRKSYDFLLRAISIRDTDQLAYSNLGNLLQKVNAPISALKAYEEALKRSDTVQNRILLITHLEGYFPEEIERIKQEYKSALIAHPNSVLLQNRINNIKN